jgi:hypothetical protein
VERGRASRRDRASGCAAMDIGVWLVAARRIGRSVALGVIPAMKAADWPADARRTAAERLSRTMICSLT